MKIEVFQFRVWDQQRGASINVQRCSTRERIAGIKGEVLKGTRREVDELLVDQEGRTILDPISEEARLLRDLSQRPGGRATISGNEDRSPMRSLTELGLVESRSLNPSTTEYEITPLGKIACTQLL